MKKLLMFTLVLFLISCTKEEMAPIDDPNDGLPSKETTMMNVAVPSGFDFESVARIKADITLDESFNTENVKVKIYQVFGGNEELIYDGFVHKTKSISDEFAIPNHVESLKILAAYAGVDHEVSQPRNELIAVFGKPDFGIPANARIAGVTANFVFCEDGGTNGSVEIYERVLVIKGSNKKDELDMDRNGSNTKVILKTDGKTRVDTEYSNSLFDCIFVYLDNGDDKVQMGSTEKPSVINLGNGKDEITASDQAKDIIYGGTGKDEITGKYPTDELIGGSSKDDIDAGSGGIVTEDGEDESCTPVCYSSVVDEDGDGYEPFSEGGVDVDDNNANVVSRSYPQGQGVFHSLVFEDLWPCQGDYDFNDLVVYYSYVDGRDGSGNISELDFTYKFPAIGGYFNNTAVLRVSDIDDNSELFRTDAEEVNVVRRHDAENGTTLYYFENIKSLYTSNLSERINCEYLKYSSFPEVRGKVIGVDGAYDLFMVPNNKLSIEVHSILGFANIGASSFLLNPVADNCDEGQALNYKTDAGYPWALSIPTEWQWPKEEIDMLQAYPDFKVFVESDSNIDWYSSSNGSRILDKIIQ